MSKKCYNITSPNEGGHVKPNKLENERWGHDTWEDQLVYKVNVPNLPDRYGIKAYLVSESRSGYIWNMEGYTGKSWPVHPGSKISGCTAAQ